MKKDTHPTYYENATITCSCGATFTVGSTKESVKTDLCSQCHPFYTGKRKLIDTEGRVDKFNAKMKAAAKLKSNKGPTKKRKGVSKRPESVTIEQLVK